MNVFLPIQEAEVSTLNGEPNSYRSGNVFDIPEVESIDAGKCDAASAVQVRHIDAETYLRNARYCYLYWGADAKVLEEMHPQLREESDGNDRGASRKPRPSSRLW